MTGKQPSADSVLPPIPLPAVYNLREFSVDSKIPKQLISAADSSSPSASDLDVYYVTDIHLEQKILDHFKDRAPSERDVRSFIGRYVKRAFEKYRGVPGLFLFGGDVANDISLVRAFFEETVKYISPGRILAILGNHELWGTPHGGLEEAVEQYRGMFRGMGITLAQNDLVLLKDQKLQYASEAELLESSPEDIRRTCSAGPLAVLGGIGFSGFSKVLNADSGIYMNAILTREEDMEQTARFKKLYDKVHGCLSDFPVLVFTHMPVENWSEKAEYEPNWIYVNGHTHCNTAVSDGSKRVYSDNQIGYHRKSLDFHRFRVSDRYDIFRYLPDGIYEIDRNQYREFNQGLGVPLQYNGSGKLYALKRSGIYCFVSEENGRTYLMDGGKQIAAGLSIDYLYANLEQYYLMMTEASEPFRQKLKEISGFVKSFGGDGTVHGSIVDIDFFNHIFLNPIDGKVTPYHATDIQNKYVYGSLGSLIEDKLPDMYPGYLETASKGGTLPELSTGAGQVSEGEPVLIWDTSIYALSKKAKGFQYMADFKIVRQWDDAVYRKHADTNLLQGSPAKIISIASEEGGQGNPMSDFIMGYVRKAIRSAIEWQSDYSAALLELGLESESPDTLRITASHTAKRAKELYRIDKIEGLEKEKIRPAAEDEIERFRRENGAS